MSVTVHTVYVCSVTVLQCKWPRALLLLLNINIYVIGCQLDWIDSLGGRCGLFAGNVQPGT